MNPRLRARFERQREEEIRLTTQQRTELAAIVGEGNVRFDSDIADLMANGIGGIAEAFAEIKDAETLKKFLEWAGERNIDYRYIGSGSRSLVREGGVRGIVIRPAGSFDFVTVESRTDDEAIVSSGPAKSVREFLKFCEENGYMGVESAYLHGGSMGGALSQNIRLDSGPIGDLVQEITVISRDGRELTLTGKGLRFEDSKLKIPRTACIVRIALKLAKKTSEEVAVSLRDVKAKYPDVPADGKSCIVGVFKDADKTRACDLIYDAGLVGVRIGGARVMASHPNAIVNEGNATTRNVVVLMNLIKDRVKQGTGIVLESAVNIIGDRVE